MSGLIASVGLDGAARLRGRAIACALCVAGWAAGCGGGGEPRGERSVDAAAVSAQKKLPKAPPGTLWGDGFGPTQREAVLDARRTVSEQIVAQVRSESEAREAEVDGEGERSSQVRVRTTSGFEHAELIKTHGVERYPAGFVARAVLDKDEAAKIYEEEIAAIDARIEQLGPATQAALAALDTTILLNAKHAPSYLREEQRRKGRVLGALGRSARIGGARGDESEAKAAALRQQSVLRLRVSGGAGEALERAVVGELSKLLARQGCRFTEGAKDAPPAGVPVADVHLKVTARNQEQSGMKWRYLGFELDVVDARNKKSVLKYSAMPSIVHGGGPTWEQADVATSRRLAEKLRDEPPAELADLLCR